MLKNAHKSAYVLVMTEEWMLIIRDPQTHYPKGAFDPFVFMGAVSMNPQE